MKKLIYTMLSILMLGMVSCNKPDPQPEPEQQDPKPEITITEGVVTENQIEFFLSAKDADEVAYLFMNTTEEVPLLTVEALFKGENVFAASAEPVSFVMENLTPETEYTVYAAASKEGKYFSEIKELTINTAEKPKLLQFVSKSKQGFSYKINSEAGQQYVHTYLEGWYFEYMLDASRYEEGDAFDEKIFVWNLLAENGILGEEPQQYDWYTGKEHPVRGDVAYIIPGTRYYVLAALWDEEQGGWTEKPEVIGIEIEEPGQSDKSVDCTIDGLSPYSVSIRMEMDAEQVSLYTYGFYEKSQYKSYVAENGIEGMKAYVAEYALGLGQAKINTYTDTWSVTPGTSYMHCLYGIDHNGDEFYQEMQVDVPLPPAVIHLSMEPYERDLEGLNTYNTVKVSCTFADFIGLDYETSAFYFAGGPVEKSMFDEIIALAGLSGSLEDLQANGDMMFYIGQSYFGLNPVVVDDALISQLKESNKFDKIYTDLKPDTEYVYMVMANYDGKLMCRLVSTKTDPAPVDVEESDAYKAYLGNWIVTGKETTDWSTYNSYNLRIERLTPNRSFKVYGWSSQQAGQDFPFEATFNPDNGKITIATPQVLGEVEIEGKKYEVHFVGKGYSMYSDDLIVLADYEGNAYTGRIYENYLMLTPEYITYAGQGQEFRSMSYVLYDRETGDYYASEPYDLVYFQTERAK